MRLINAGVRPHFRDVQIFLGKYLFLISKDLSMPLKSDTDYSYEYRKKKSNLLFN